MKGSNYADNDALAEVINFLDAYCPRQPEIIEAGSMGMLCNELLTELLSVKESVETTIALYRQGCSAKSTERAAAQKVLEVTW